MICRECATAADLRSGRDGTPIEEGAGAANADDMVARLHAACLGCDCQHKARRVVPNLPAVPTAESRALARAMLGIGG